MQVETLGAAKNRSWKVHVRCDGGYRQEKRSMRRCVFRGQLDLQTLVATRGPNFLALEARVAPHVSNLRE